MNGREEIGLDESTYHSDPSLSHSRVETYIQSPRLFYAKHVAKTIWDSDTPARKLGRMLHCATFEPERWTREFVTHEWEHGATSNVGKAERKQWYANHPGITIVDAKEKKQIDGMAASLMENPQSRRMLVELEGAGEHSLFWKDDETDLACRCRLDRRLTQLSAIVDLKSARFVTPDDLKRQAFSYGYHRKAAFYSEAHRQVYGETPEAFWFVSVHSSAPYEVCVWSWDAAAEAIGWTQCRSAMNAIAKAYETKDWRAPWELEVVQFAAPRWAQSNEQDEDVAYGG